MGDEEFMAKVRQYLSIKKAIEASTETLKVLDSELKKEMTDRGLTRIEVDGRRISFVQYPQRTIDIEELSKLVSVATFRSVTEPKIKTEMFDSAVLLGKIPADVANKVTKLTPVEQLRVGK